MEDFIYHGSDPDYEQKRAIWDAYEQDIAYSEGFTNNYLEQEHQYDLH